MSDYQRINANFVEIGEDTGEPSLKGALGQTLKVNASLVDEKRDPIISYIEPIAPATVGTINFHNQNILNFSGGGGGGGGDTFLAGGVSLVNPQEFTGFNRFDNECQFADGVLFSDDGTNINGKIHATASALHIETNNALDTIAMKLHNGGGTTNTLELKQDPSATTQNALFIQQVAGAPNLSKVLTNSTQDLGVIVDAVEVSPNTFTASNTFTSSTTTNGITNSGGLTNSDGIVNTGGLTSDVMTCQGLLSTQSLTASQNIVGNQVLSNGDITCGVGSNFIVGTNQISSSDLFDFSSILNTSATQQTKSGNLIVSQLTSSAGVVSFTLGDGANIQNDTTNNVLVTSTTNATDGMNWRLGTDSDDTLRLRYDANGGGAGIPRYFLEMIDPSIVSDPPTYFQFSGNSLYDVATLIGLLNNTSLTFNGTTTTTFDAGSTVLLNGTTTLASGVTDIGKTGVTYGVFGKLASLSDRSDTDLNPVRVNPSLVSPLVASASPFQAPTYVYNRKGTNGSSVPIYEVVINGNVTKSTGWDGNGDQLIFTLPVNFRPSGRITYRAQARGGRSASRVDITTVGEVYFIDGGGTSTTYTELSLSGMSFFANI